jgi:hypothetical protein
MNNLPPAQPPPPFQPRPLLARLRNLNGEVVSTQFCLTDQIPPQSVVTAYNQLDLITAYLEMYYTKEASQAIMRTLLKSTHLTYHERLSKLYELGIPLAEASFILSLLKAEQEISRNN